MTVVYLSNTPTNAHI